jgi:hypothetical protein
MPHFYALSDYNPFVDGEYYALSVIPPEPTAPAAESVTAYVCPHAELDLISRELAAKYKSHKPAKDGTIEIILRQYNPATDLVHEFKPIRIAENYCEEWFGANYLQLGMPTLRAFFNIQDDGHDNLGFESDHLYFVPREGYRLYCKQRPYKK